MTTKIDPVVYCMYCLFLNNNAFTGSSNGSFLWNTWNNCDPLTVIRCSPFWKNDKIAFPVILPKPNKLGTFGIFLKRYKVDKVHKMWEDAFNECPDVTKEIK